jgi:hypothetical protein
MYYQLAHRLRAALPPPVTNSTDDFVRRDNAAIAEAVSLLPANAEEASLAAQFVAASAQALSRRRRGSRGCVGNHRCTQMNAECRWFARPRAIAPRVIRVYLRSNSVFFDRPQHPLTPRATVSTHAKRDVRETSPHTASPTGSEQAGAVPGRDIPPAGGNTGASRQLECAP